MLRRFQTVPPAVLAVVLLLFILPPLSYILTARVQVLSPLRPFPVLASYNIINLIFLATCWVLAGGLLFARRWAYYLFLVFAAALLAYNAVLLLGTLTGGLWVTRLVGRQFGTGVVLANSLVIAISAGAIVYFLHRETAAPYLSLLPRGWRRRARNTIPVEVLWEAAGERRGGSRVVNISLSGLYLPIERKGLLHPGDTLRLSVDTSDGATRDNAALEGTVLRAYVDESGQAGVAVRLAGGRAAADGRARLSRFLDQHYAPRYLLRDPVFIHKSGMPDPEASGPAGAELYNISRHGVYVCSSRQPGEGNALSIEVPGKKLRLAVRVRWLNAEGEHGKPSGFGAEITGAHPRSRFLLLIGRLALFAPIVR